MNNNYSGAKNRPRIHHICHCGRGRYVATTAERWVKKFSTPQEAEMEAMFKAMDEATAEAKKGYSCCIWNCIADYILLNICEED